MSLLPSPRIVVQRARGLVATNFGTFRGMIRAYLGQLEFLTGNLDRHVRLEQRPVGRLIFVCLGNINRSAFAEGVARKFGVAAHSIGLSTTTGAPASHLAMETAERFDVDLSSHAATDMKDYRFELGDLLLTMEIRHANQLLAHSIPAEAIVLLGNWSSPHRIHLHDPHTLSNTYFLTCFTLIDSAVRNLIDALRTSGALPRRP